MTHNHYMKLLKKLRDNGYLVISHKSYNTMPGLNWFENEVWLMNGVKKEAAIKEHYLITINNQQ